jgi:hypothetical protein
MKVFLSHKMSGLSEEEVMKIRKECKEYLESKFGEIEIIDNYTHEDAPENAGRLWHLGRSIQQMEEADAIYFHPGTCRISEGCRIEYEIYKEYDLTAIV